MVLHLQFFPTGVGFTPDRGVEQHTSDPNAISRRDGAAQPAQRSSGGGGPNTKGASEPLNNNGLQGVCNLPRVQVAGISEGSPAFGIPQRALLFPCHALEPCAAGVDPSNDLLDLS